jgi:hypothetical protein
MHPSRQGGEQFKRAAAVGLGPAVTITQAHGARKPVGGAAATCEKYIDSRSARVESFKACTH